MKKLVFAGIYLPGIYNTKEIAGWLPGGFSGSGGAGGEQDPRGRRGTV